MGAACPAYTFALTGAHLRERRNNSRPPPHLAAHTFTHRRGSHEGAVGRLKQIGIHPARSLFASTVVMVNLFLWREQAWGADLWEKMRIDKNL